MIELTDDNCHQVIYDIVKNSKNCNKAIEKLTKLKYPNSKHYIKEEEAKYFYSKYSKINIIIKMDKKFTKKAYDLNTKIYKDIYVC